MNAKGGSWNYTRIYCAYPKQIFIDGSLNYSLTITVSNHSYPAYKAEAIGFRIVLKGK